jgi:hypothetical protein
MADQAVIDKLATQILSQGLTSQWKGTGHGSAQKNAEDMAKIMADTGITDIRQFGKVPIYAPVQEIGQFYNGYRVHRSYFGDGAPVYEIYQGTGQYDENGNELQTIVELPQGVNFETVYGQDNGNGELEAVDSSKIKNVNGQLVVDTGQTSFGNKATGKAVANTYGERQTGNSFGGTFAGSGNTGYRVQFTPDGTPIFYTTYATSNDLAILMQDLGPIGQIGLALATGGLSIPQQIAAQVAIQVLSGADLETVIKNAAVSFATAQIPGTDVMKDVNKFITDLGLPAALTTTLNNAVQTAAVSGGKALLTGQNLTDAIVNGFTSGGLNGAVNALLPNIDGFKDLNNTQKRLVTNAVTGFVSGKPLDQILINTAIAAATQQVSDQRRLNAPLDEQAISELTPEEKAVYDESGTQGLKAYLDSLKTKPTGDDGTSGTGTDTVTVTGANGCLANEYWDPVLKSCQTRQIDTSTGTGTGTDTGNITVTACGEGKVRNAAGICEDINCGEGKYWDPVTKQCELKKVDTSTGTGTGIETVTVTSCPAGQVRNSAGICEAINCGEGKYWDPITKQCEVKKIDTIDTGTGTGVDTVTVTSCGEGKVRNAAGICENINCGDGKYWDPITKQCEVKKIDDVVTTLTCGANEEKSPDGLSCLPKCGPGYKRGPDGITCVKDDEIVITSCGEGKVRNAKGDCVDIDCGDGKYWDPITKQCELKKVDDTPCDAGFHKNEVGLCVADDDKGCDSGFESVNGKCVPVCKEGYIRNLATGVCETAEKTCPAGQMKNAAGVCVPITVPPVTCPPGQTKNAAGICVSTTTTTTTTPSFVPTAIPASTETTSPIYAGPMGAFDLFATLPELLADDTDKEDKKKTTRQTQQTTKMATGGHLDDLLAEQMTVDDLLNLLR